MQGFLPVAYYLAVWCLVAYIGMTAILYVEVRLQNDMLVCHAVAVLDTAKVLIAPCEQVAKKHNVVAAVHLRIGLVAIPQLPDSSSTILSHVSP